MRWSMVTLALLAGCATETPQTPGGATSGILEVRIVAKGLE